ncbi:unnamed protein product [Paramecium sonneborni]|uniref:Uncharacterized protein n=1 Tax=Paramecium sonneborni TaxID=65129 RepID=A0A8S1JV42_9CILI|nr:unnamed protein product [Paramecium sonneborni]
MITQIDINNPQSNHISSDDEPKQHSNPGQQELKKLKKIIDFTKEEFEQIRKEFQDQYINVSQFVFILQDIKKADVQTLVYFYQLIDTLEKNLVNFEQFSNFLVEMYDWINREHSLYTIKLKQKEIEGQKINPIDKMFEIDGQFAYLEQNQKKLCILNPNTFEEITQISISNISILNVLYIKDFQTLVMSSNDKFLNFYDLKANKLQSRFQVPELQSHLQYSQENKVLYTATDNGSIYSWDIEKIFSKEFLEFIKSGPKLSDCFKLVIVDQPLMIEEQKKLDKQENKDKSEKQDGLVKKGITCMLCIDCLEILAVGSNDTLIRLYENKIKTTEKQKMADTKKTRIGIKKTLSGDHKVLQGHKKRIKQFSYCPEFKYLISCSYDYDVVIWNIYLEHPVAKLLGHEASLVSVLSISKRIPIIVSCDIKGVIRVWDPKTFQSIQHIKLDETNNNIKSIIYLKQKDIVIVGCRNFLMYEFQQSFDPNVTDDMPIQCLCYSNKYLELHIATRKTIKTWCMRTGLIKRLSGNFINHDIQSFCLDYTQRRGFIGTHLGNIFCVDLLTGKVIKEMKNNFLKEISHISYSQIYHTLIACSWDKQIRVYHDEDNKEIILRNIKNAHPSEIYCGAFSENLMLIATSSKQQEIRIWDFEKGTQFSRLKASGEVLYLKFLDPYPLLACSDHQGQIVIYIVLSNDLALPPNQSKSCAVIWKNMFTIMKASPVYSIEFNNIDTCLLIGDENGDIRSLSISQIIKNCNIKKIKHSDIAQNRNPHRFFQLNYQEYDFQLESLCPLLSERSACQVAVWKAHKTQIKQILVSYEFQEGLIISLSLDMQVKIWNNAGKLLLILKQGQNQPYNLITISKFKTKNQSLIDQVESELPKLRSAVPIKKTTRFRSVTQHDKNKTLLGFDFKDQHKQLDQIDSLSIFQTLKELEKMEEKKELRKKREQEQSLKDQKGISYFNNKRQYY